jgi:aminopeptidase N
MSLFVFTGCKAKKSAQIENSSTPEVFVEEGTIESVVLNESGPYQQAETKLSDLLHTSLELSFDWENQWCYGDATLKLEPYFYHQNTLVLDAKGFEIKKIALIENGDLKSLNYEYDGEKITITLDRTYKKGEQYSININYIAKPNELAEGGSAAITGDKGLYFINPDGSEPNKPQQIWTQGETESNSCWFPTIDAPNEKMTQEISVTVDEKYVTLSNGRLEYSILNGDGTRTDRWKQDLPHAPYLVTLVVGEFEVITDSWRDMEVSYYVEKEFAESAMDVWGNTPEMIEFFSTVLNYDYPWDKYSQVVVRDFVSGAMENTTASTFFEVMNQKSRELLDGDNEDIIAHELFHQWFGDVVTCESWSNLPLNESFATYGEYLWDEYKYGREKADEKMLQNWSLYLNSAKAQEKDLIRFYYESREDMFDTHSYQKGGAILHMLRKYVGDEAFFKSLSYYLNQYQFTDVEIHQLRMSFEKITGEDLNWFFNQWFMGKGHPELTFSHDFNIITNEVSVIVKQKLEADEGHRNFTLPIDIDFYLGDEVIRKRYWHKNLVDTFIFKTSIKPKAVNIDAEKMILGIKTDIKEMDEWRYLYANAPLFMDRMEALGKISQKSDSLSQRLILSAISDPNSTIAAMAIGKLNNLNASNKTKAYNILKMQSQNNKSSKVRAASIKAIAANYLDITELKFFENKTTDKSYLVISSALDAVYDKDAEKGYAAAKTLEGKESGVISRKIASIYSKQGNIEDKAFFENLLLNTSGYEVLYQFQPYQNYLNKVDNQAADKSAIEVFVQSYNSTGISLIKNLLKGNIKSIQSRYNDEGESDFKAYIQTQLDSLD